MFVSGVQNYSQRVSFGSTTRSVYNNGKLVRKNTTSFYRQDINWNKFADLLNKKYHNSIHVNILDCACSDGSEAWSLAALLKHTAGDGAGKYFPIYASDSDSTIINRAAAMTCDMDDGDLYIINNILKTHYSKYFTPAMANDSNYPMALQPNSELMNTVRFRKSDIFNEIDNINCKNNIVLCRNFWAYLTSGEREKLAQKLSEKLDDSSLVVIGSLEKGWKCDELLKKHGFVETEVENVYTKPSEQNMKFIVSPEYYTALRYRIFCDIDGKYSKAE